LAHRAHRAHRAGEGAAGPARRECAHVRELGTKREGGTALACFHHCGASARPHPHDPVAVIGRHGAGEHVPPPLGALARTQRTEPLGYWPHQHWLAAAWAPDPVIDDELNAVVISALLVCRMHGLRFATDETSRQSVGLVAEAWTRLAAWVETRAACGGPKARSVPPRTPRVAGGGHERTRAAAAGTNRP